MIMIWKKISTVACFSLFAAAAFAQQALWGGGNLISPEINSDNSVTFRLHAPKASKVIVQGDFKPYSLEMKETNNGVWEATTESLPSELYCYSFCVNGSLLSEQPAKTKLPKTRHTASEIIFFILIPPYLVD